MKTRLQYFFIALTLLASICQAASQGATAFTYQGQLRDGGTNANGTYTMQFKLYDSSGGNNQIGSTFTTSPTLVNGLFSVNLDFGNVFNGAARWLDITVTEGGTTQELSPRVQVLPAPYAQFAAVAATVTNGAIMNSQLAGSAVNTTNIASGQVVKTLNGLTDAVSLAAGANVTLATNGNSLQISVGGSGANYIPNVQLFHNVTNATFTVPAGVTRIEVVMWGGGGGGGGAYIHSATTNSLNIPGGGGGAGCYAFNFFYVTPGANYSVTTGSPGLGGGSGTPGQNGTSGSASSFGALMTAGGGGGGQAAGGLTPGAGGSGASCTGAIAPIESKSGQRGLVYGLGSNNAGGDGGNGASAWAGGIGGWGNGYPNSEDYDAEGVGAGGAGAGAATGAQAGDGGSGAIFIYY